MFVRQSRVPAEPPRAVNVVKGGVDRSECLLTGRGARCKLTIRPDLRPAELGLHVHGAVGVVSAVGDQAASLLSLR